MTAIAGPPLSISLDGRDFQTESDSAGSPSQGGRNNEYKSNGDQNTGRVIQTPVGWRMSDQPIEIDMSTDDFDYLDAKKDAGKLMEVVATYPNDVVFDGLGTLEGELTLDPMTATSSITLAGPGKFKKV